MKKHNLMKLIAICFLAVVVLSWIIPTGTFSNGTFTLGKTSPVGLIDLFRLPVMTVQTFIQYFIVLLAIGGFYGVLNKTGVYGSLVDGIAKKAKGKEKVTLVVMIIIFAILASLTGNTILLIALVPFAGATILSMGYSKITAMLTTVGSIIVGCAGSTFGFSGAGYIKNIFNIEITDEIITRVILFAILTGLYIFFVSKIAKLPVKEKVEKTTKTTKTTKTSKTKKETVKEAVKKVEEPKKEVIPFLYKEDKANKSKWPLIIISMILIILCFVGMYNWYYGINVTAFNEFHTKINSIMIGEYPIVSNILSGLSNLGYWGNYELSVALIIGAVIIGWLYNVKIDDFIDSFAKGMKEMLPVAFIATLCNMVFTIMLSSEANIYATIVNWLGGFASGFNLPIVTLVSIVGSIFYNDFYYLLMTASELLSTYDAVYYPIIGVVTTAIHSIVMLIVPTSVVLVIGLKYFGVSYKEWFKTIWKYLLEALVIVIIVAIIVIVLI